MKKLRMSSFILPLSLLALMGFSFTGCKSKQVQDDQTSAIETPNLPAADENNMGDSDSGKAMGLRTIHFPYDAFTLDASAKEDLKTNADILKSNSGLKVQIEGHCDVRGGREYNIALGEKRAKAVKAYLQDMGISHDRITTVSYGKEKLLDLGQTEDAHAKNRRGNFVITSK